MIVYKYVYTHTQVFNSVTERIHIYFFFNFILFLNFTNCISFAKYQNESATGIHVLYIFNIVYVCVCVYKYTYEHWYENTYTQSKNT